MDVRGGEKVGDGSASCGVGAVSRTERLLDDGRPDFIIALNGATPSEGTRRKERVTYPGVTGGQPVAQDGAAVLGQSVHENGLQWDDAPPATVFVLPVSGTRTLAGHFGGVWLDGLVQVRPCVHRTLARVREITR